MAKVAFYLAALTLAVYLILAFELLRGNRQIKFLRDIEPISRRPLPAVSVIVAARNEARNLEAGLTSLLDQDYPGLEYIVVNDRSTDRTGEILNAIAQRDSRVKPLHITELPPGWLGKNNAHHRGAQQATGDYLLFTDADIVMEPTTILRAVSYAETMPRDHVAVGPEAVMPGVLLKAFIGVFGFFFFAFMRPWRAADPKSSRFIGIGAFNLIRAEAYRRVGGHTDLRMRPDDDVKLGKVLKKNGYRQELLHGTGMVLVEWYSSVRELINGTEKNFFAGIEYNLAMAIGAPLLQLILFVWPYAAVFLTTGPARWLNLAIVAMSLAGYAYGARIVGGRRRYAPLFPFAVLMFVYLLLNSTCKTLVNGGINWRGTRYSLAELKANKV
jgi:cellulose synthase/poly-beta-1,6-N-acetylglucosamine synthase-like glycosyltransferase